MRDLPDDPTFPALGEFFAGDAIDSDWQDATAAMHYLWSRYGSTSQGPHYPAANPWTTTSTTFVVSEDNGTRRLDDRPMFIHGERAEIAHDNFVGTSDHRVYLVLVRAENLEIDVYFGAFSGTSPHVQQSTSSVDTLVADSGSREWVGQTYATDQNFSELQAIFQARVPTDGETGEWHDSLILEIPKANQSTYLDSLQVFGSAYIGALGDGDTISTWDKDGATGSFEGNGGPVMRRGAVNTGANTDPVHAAELPSTKSAFFRADCILSGASPWVLGFATKYNNNGPLAFKKNGSGTSIVLIDTSSGDVRFQITTSGGSFSHTTSATTGTWHDWLFLWDGSEIRTYQDGELQNTTSTTGDLSADDTGDGLYLGSNGVETTITDTRFAMPYLLTSMSVDERNLRRVIDWRRAHTEFGGVII